MTYCMSESDAAWAYRLLKKINEKERMVLSRNRDKIPYSTEHGVFDDYSSKEKIGWWTNGFWAGLLWLLYSIFDAKEYREAAEKIEMKLDASLMDAGSLDHDTGFKWLPTAVADYMLTGKPESKNRGRLAADNLAGRLNLAAGLIRAWNDNGDGSFAGWAIIDCMMNLSLLYWAADTFKDPRYRQIAECHADHAMKAFVREDGSVNHIITFNPETGELIKALGGQGLGEGSSWTRGQAWGLYGFTNNYKHTGKQEYLDTACKIADYIISKIPENYLIPVDFCQAPDCEFEDSTAAAIIASGLIELSVLKGVENNHIYMRTAVKLLKTLETHSLNLRLGVDYLLWNCSAAYKDEKHNFSIIYGDFFFIEALSKLADKEIDLW